MARHRDSQIRRELTSLISPRRIRAVARELGAVRRRRKVDVVALVYSLVLGFATGDRRTLAGLRRAYERVTGTCLAPSAFYDRFTPELASVMKLVSYPLARSKQSQIVTAAMGDLNATRPTRFVGSKLQDAVARMHGEPIDFDGTLHYQTQRSKWRPQTMPVRIVGVWNPAALRYHLYLTNVPREKLGLEHVPAVYAARWEIELLFRELKTQYRIDDLRSRSRHVTECLLYASLLTLAVSRRLHKLLAPNPERLPQRHPLDRWAVLFTAISRDLLDLVIGPTSQRSFIAVRLRRFLLHEAPDPNRRRLLLPVRAQLGQFGALG